MRALSIFLLMMALLIPTSKSFASWQCMVDAGRMYGVNPYILYAIAKVESGFNPRAVNRNKNGTYDIGMFQINTSNLARLGIDYRYAFDPCYSAYLGAYILRQCINTYGNTWKSIDCYNKGFKARGSSEYVYRVYKALSGVRYE